LNKEYRVKALEKMSGLLAPAARACRLAACAGLCLLLLQGGAARAAVMDLVSNGGFEEGRAGYPMQWELVFNGEKGQAVWATDEVHGGSRAAGITAATAAVSGENSPGWRSPLVAVPSESVHASAWIRTEGVVQGSESWHRASAVVACFDADRAFIENADLVRLDGTTGWTLYERDLALPAGTRYISFRFVLTTCSGRAWADDVSVTAEGGGESLEGQVLLQDPRVRASRSVDVYDVDSIIAGILTPGMTDEEKAIAVHLFIWESAYDSVFPHECVGSPGGWCNCSYDVPRLMNMYPWGECGMYQGLIAELMTAAGLPARKAVINSDSHWVTEVYFDDAWHYFESRWGKYWCKDDGTIASLDDLLVESLPACPGPGSLGGTSPEKISDYYILYGHADPVTGVHIPHAYPHSMRKDLRRGETYTLSYEKEGGTGIWYCPPGLPEETVSAIETRNGRPLEEGPGCIDSTPSEGWLPKPAFCNSRIVYAPDFEDGSYVDGVVRTTNTAPAAADGLRPGLHAAAAGEDSSIVFDVSSPLIIVAAFLDGVFTRAAAGDEVRLAVSTDLGWTWQDVWTMDGTGTAPLERLDISSYVYGAYRYFVRVDFLASADPGDAGIDALSMENVLQSSALTVPRLGIGENTVTVSFDNPELPEGSRFTVEYVWTEGGAERSETIDVVRSPTEHTIACPAEPTMRYVTMTLAGAEPAPPDADEEIEPVPDTQTDAAADAPADVPREAPDEEPGGRGGCSCTLI
jgi:hypothetical protein